MKRTICILLVFCIAFTCGFAMALTGEEALGLTTSEDGSTTSKYPTLQLGSRDQDDSVAYVVMLQNRLVELGYLSSRPDGQYGTGTESAIVKFQEANGLMATGIADSSTQTILFSTSAKPYDNSANADSNIMRVQQMLIRWGFMMGTADGVSGTTTEEAVAEFKNYVFNEHAAEYAAFQTAAPDANATPTPYEQPEADDILLSKVDEPTLEEKLGQNGTIDEGVMYFVNNESSFNVYYQDVMKGTSGIETWRVQRRLHQLKYLYTVDGSAGGLTELSLKYFQRQNGLPETGIADRPTQEALFSNLAVNAEEYVFPYKIFVNLSQQRVYIFGWDGASYSKEIGVTKCSSGKAGYATPTGTYQSGGKCTAGQWYYFNGYNCFAKYAYRIVGGVLFHSVLYDSRKKGPTNSSVSALGRPASHGCVRLSEAAARWIFENCPEGTTIVISY